MKNWFKLMLIKDIQIFIGFANFYQHFIIDASKIAILLIFLLKITRLLKLTPKKFKIDHNKIVGGGNSKI